MTDLPDAIAHLERLIAFPTVSSESNLDLIEDTADRLEALGARVNVLRNDAGTKANLWATFGPETDGGIVLSGHTDVVPVEGQDWTTEPFRLTERDGLLFGRGACDMKGFVAACLAMAPRFAEAASRRPLHFAFTHDEEVGCIGAQSLVETLRARGTRPALAIIGEPTSMKVIDGHKGVCEYCTTFHGLGGHGSAPDRGVNAVGYAVRYAARLQLLAERLRRRAPAEPRFDPPWTTINVGMLNGGFAPNVIPGRAVLEWEMRPVQPGDAAFVREDLAAYVERDLLPAMRAVHPEAGISTESLGEVEGLEPMDDNAARDLLFELTGRNDAQTVAFGTEAGIFQSLGLSAAVCGPGSIEQAHKPDEYVSRGQLQQCLDMLDRLAARL